MGQVPVQQAQSPARWPSSLASNSHSSHGSQNAPSPASRPNSSPLNAPTYPHSYLLVGDGRVARHFAHYFSLEGLSFKTWTRRSFEPLQALAEGAHRILLPISDSALPAFAQAHRETLGDRAVHFSGALTIDGVPGAHPLMTFSHELYDLETYRQIPFVHDESREFADLLPGLRNPSSPIAVDKKPLYHALCVLSGNFTTLLWEKTFMEFREQLDLPPQVLLSYLRQVTRNLERSMATGESVLTGPLARGDQNTIAAHLNVLHQDPYENVYRAFVEAHRAEKEGQP